MVKNKCGWNRLRIPRIPTRRIIMIKLTPKIAKQIKDSNIPIVDITLEDLKNVTISSKKPPLYSSDKKPK
jgi:hypothetical protein